MSSIIVMITKTSNDPLLLEIRDKERTVVVTMGGETAEVLARVMFRGNQRKRFFHAALNKVDKDEPLLHLGAEAPFDQWP